MTGPSRVLSRAEWRAAVRQAMQAVPRERFVRPEDRDYAHLDCALPIGYGQTISQPSLVARMTELLELQPGDKVLEIGTGSGYQTAILARLEGVDVYSVEIIPELAAAAAERLRALGLSRIHLKQGDGYDGWAEHAPYAGIIVTAAPETTPPPLLQQLAEAGRLVIPVGPRYGQQRLRRIVRHGADFQADDVLAVAFVPLTRRAAPHP
jgi:protein-L-isoaspartate(D-aspartate) O-methyltransferase